jgi:methylitaconate Delta-isomerase
MTPDTGAIPCSVLRGGTSRGVFFRAEDLPSARSAIEPILMSVMGTPDIRQINGIGGATSQTSKVAIIGPPSRADADLDYTFAQVAVAQPVVDWGGNCGNISSAVGPYAINTGIVQAESGVTTVRIHNTNTQKIIVAQVPTIAGRAATVGDCVIPGVPGTGARIELDFVEPCGSVTGALLPTGKAQELITVADGQSFRVSVVDAANPVAFLLASELGLSGTETPQQIEANTTVTSILEEVRGIVAERLGVVASAADATAVSPGLPKVGFVAPPSDHITTTGSQVLAGQADLVGRLMSMQTAHRTYMLTGAVCTAAAAVTDGTVVHEVAKELATDGQRRTVRIAHPYGIMNAIVTQTSGVITSVAVERTARAIMDGRIHVPAELLS